MTKYLPKYILILLLFLGLRVHQLGPDITNTDAPRWHYRSQNFLQALKTGNFDDTYQHYQPGVTLMWLNASTKQITQTYQDLENADLYPTIHFYSKLAIVLILTVLLSTQLILLEKVFDSKIAIIYGLLMATEPYLLGIDRWFHLTSLETYFAFTSFLTLLYWKNTKNQKILYFAAFLFGLSVLSKITTLLILPVFIYILLFDKKIKNVAIFGFLSILTVFTLFPALLTDAGNVITKVVTAGTAAVNSNYRNDLLSPFNRIFFYFVVLGFKLGFVTLIFFLISLPKYKNKYVLLLLLNYLVVLSLAQQKIDRYAIAMFPSILLVISTFIATLDKKYIKIFTLGFVLQISYTLHTFTPVFSAYYSPLLGGATNALSWNIYDNSGEYFSNAAFYLNSKSRDSNVAVVNGLASFQMYYKGNMQTQVNADTDYVVSSYDLTRKEINKYGCMDLEKSFGSRQLDVVYIFKCKGML